MAQLRGPPEHDGIERWITVRGWTTHHLIVRLDDTWAMTRCQRRLHVGRTIWQVDESRPHCQMCIDAVDREKKRPAP